MTATRTLPDGTTYIHLKTIQDNDRYRVELIKQFGEERILKRCNDPELKTMLRRDIENSFYLEAARSYNAESVFRVRKIYSYGEDWYIAEKLEGEPLYTREPNRSLAEDLRIARDLYAPFTYETSVYTPQVMLGKYPFRDVAGKPNKEHAAMLLRLEDRLNIALQGGFIEPEQAARLAEFVAAHLGEVQYGVELYDLDPWEMLILPKEYKIGVIDLEYMNLRGRRHFDMVYNYLRLWLDVKRPPVARATLERYMEIAGEEQLDGAFLALFGMKLSGYLMDAARWMHDTNEAGKPVVYSHKECEALLNRYLEFDLRALVRD